ncbi:hypothetical protein ACLBWJ_13135 [Microbacterium sp. M4A5_1d]
MRLSQTKTVDGRTYTLTCDASMAPGIDDYLWRAFDGSGETLDVTQEEFEQYGLDG